MITPSEACPRWPDYQKACQQIAEYDRQLANWCVDLPAPAVEPIDFPLFAAHQLEVALLCAHRLDPVISGNKWYKLKYNLLAAKLHGYSHVVSWGGVWSNHLHALAAAGQRLGLQTVGIVRGQEHAHTDNPMLADVRRWGMQLHFVSRQQYASEKRANQLPTELGLASAYVIPEGGDNELGVLGCMTMLPDRAGQGYDAVVMPVGTGCTLLGVRLALPESVGIHAILPLRDQQFATQFQARLRAYGLSGQTCYIDQQWHFGGFGKITKVLQDFMAEFTAQSGVPLDPVYTGKMLYGVCQRVKAGFWPPGTRLLIIHTGGLQGRRSFLEQGDNSHANQ